MESSRICLSSLGSTGTEFLYLDALNRQAMMMVLLQLLPCAVGLQTCHCLQQHTGIHSLVEVNQAILACILYFMKYEM